jgi:mannose-6-phosphate isomerase-like protein (cupin superfamily)
VLGHSLDVPEVVIVYQGSLRVYFDDQEQTVDGPLQGYDMVSIPAGVQRRLLSVGDEPLLAVVVTSGDGRARPRWSDDVVTTAQRAGIVLDRDGYLAPASVVNLSTIDD